MTTDTAIDGLPAVDGRVLRGQRNRVAIVEALLDIYASGNLRPTAAQVAEAAGLSTRSVYHHFDDMKSLILEVSDTSEQRVGPLDIEGLKSTPLADRVTAFAEHRFDRWATTAPVIRAGLLAEYDSKLVTELLRLGRRHRLDELAVVFGPEIESCDDPEAIMSGLDAVFGFETWHRLTEIRDLDDARATKVVAKLALALL